MSKHPIQTGAWWKAAGIRALKTWAQTLVALLGTDLIGVTAVDWAGILSVGAVAAILSILTSIAGLPEVPEGPDLPVSGHIEPAAFGVPESQMGPRTRQAVRKQRRKLENRDTDPIGPLTDSEQ